MDAHLSSKAAPDVWESARDGFVVGWMCIDDLASVRVHNRLSQKVYKVERLIHLLQQVSLEVLPASIHTSD